MTTADIFANEELVKVYVSKGDQNDNRKYYVFWRNRRNSRRNYTGADLSKSFSQTAQASAGGAGQGVEQYGFCADGFRKFIWTNYLDRKAMTSVR